MTRPSLLVTLADRNFVDQAKQLFSSVYWNAGWKGQYMLLACEVPETALKWFREKGILVKEVKPLFDATPQTNTLLYPPTVTCKLALFSEEFKKWSSVVFVDADCIVRYSLDSLTKLRGFWAARDWLETALIKYQTRRPEDAPESDYFQQLNGYSPTATAFNTGVFAFNTEIINNTIRPELGLILQKYGGFARFGEQLWMNLYFYKKWKKLPMEYNLFASYLHIKRGFSKNWLHGVVLHFPRCGNEDNLRCWGRNNAFYDEWRGNLERADLIDLKIIPKPKIQRPGQLCLLLQKWRLRLALHNDYFNFYRDKISGRGRMRNYISGVLQH